MLKRKISLLEASNAELHRELQERKVTSESFMKRAFDAQVLCLLLMFLVIIKCQVAYVNLFCCFSIESHIHIEYL